MFPFDYQSKDWVSRSRAGQYSSKLLRYYRETREITRKELAARLEVEVDQVRHWERSKVDVLQVDAIAKALDLDQEKHNLLLHACLPALDCYWLSSQPEGKQAGYLLAAYRDQTGMSQDDLEAKLHLTDYTVSAWEQGKSPIAGPQLPAIRRHLKLDSDQFAQLIAKIYPALDPDWLAMQDSRKQAGLLLEAIRTRFGLEAKQFNEMLGVSKNMTALMEHGKQPIREERTEQLINFFKALDQLHEPGDQWFNRGVEERFRRACQLSHGGMQANSTHLGATLDPKQQRVRKLDQDKGNNHKR